MSHQTKEEFWSYIVSYVFSASMMSLSVGLIKAMLFGFFGGFAGMLARALWFKLFPKK